MGDSIEKAQELDGLFRDNAVATFLSARRMERAHAPVIDCIDCGDEIPEARRRAVPLATRCIGCQEKHERRN